MKLKNKAKIDSQTYDFIMNKAVKAGNWEQVTSLFKDVGDRVLSLTSLFNLFKKINDEDRFDVLAELVINSLVNQAYSFC